MKDESKVRILDYDAVHGFVDYGEVDLKKNGGYSAKMRCKKCGAAWLDINHLNGYDTCPKCGASGREYVVAMS